MSRNGNGTYNLPAGNPVVTGTTISSTWANNTLADMANAITGSIAADGQTPITGGLKGTNGTVSFAGVGQTKIPSGTTAQRAASPTDGMIRYNTDLKQYEGYRNGSWSIFGNGAGGTLFSDTVTATQGQTVITMPTGYVLGGDNLSVYVNGSRQIYNVNYTETTTDSFTFTTGLNAGDLVNYTIGASTSLSVNATSVLYNEGGTGAVDTNVEAKLQQTVSVKDFGATGDGVTDDTAAIQLAIDSTSVTGATLYVPAGTYMVTPATVQTDEAGTNTVAFLMKSNMSIYADLGATFKISDGVSSDAAPKRMAMFFSNQVLSNIKFVGLTMDMNGANNPISPARPTTYNLYTQAHILFSGTPSGVAACGNNVYIEKCSFINTAGVTCIGLMQSNTVGVTLGNNWTIKNNLFSNNGLDTNDHSSIYGWSENILVDGNTFTNSTPYATVGSTGGNVAYEVHGAYTKFTNNYVKNYYQGIWVASNLTSPTTNVIINNNSFYTSFYGIAFYRESVSETAISQINIENNAFYLDNFVPSISPLPDTKVAVLINTSYAVTNVLVANNIASAGVSTIPTAFSFIGACAIAGQLQNDITIRGNKANGLSVGQRVGTIATNGLGYIFVQDNDFTDLTPPSGGGTTIGIYASFVTTASSIALLSLKGNNIADTRTSSQTTYGIYLSGIVNTLYVSNNTYKNTLTADYIEVGLTVTTRRGLFNNLVFTPTFKTSGGAITLGNGSVLGRVSISDGQSGVQQVTLNATITVGSTTVLPAGNLQMTLPYTALVSGIQYFGTTRIFNGGAFYFGVFEVDGTGSTASFQVNGGTYATTTSPVTITTGDVLAVQLTYIAQG